MSATLAIFVLALLALAPAPDKIVNGQTTTTEAPTTTTATTTEPDNATTAAAATTTTTSPALTLPECEASMLMHQLVCYTTQCAGLLTTDHNCMQDCYRMQRHGDRLYCENDELLTVDCPFECDGVIPNAECAACCIPDCTYELLLGTVPIGYGVWPWVGLGIAVLVLVFLIAICVRQRKAAKHYKAIHEEGDVSHFK